MDIRVTEARSTDPDEDFVGSDVGNRDIPEFDFSGGDELKRTHEIPII